MQIDSRLYEIQALSKKISNFRNTLPDVQSELALKAMKDPYIFDLLFYHLKLKCYIVVELKPRKFEPKYVG